MHYKATIIKPVCYQYMLIDKSMGEIDIVLNKNVEMKGHISVEEGWIIH